MEWNLEVLYPSFEDKKFIADMNAILPQINEITQALSSDMDEKALLESSIKGLTSLLDLFLSLSSYTQLTLSTDAQNAAAGSAWDKLMVLSVSLSQCFSAFTRRVGKMDNLNELIQSSPLLAAHGFYLRSTKEQAAHTLDEAIEPWMLKMSLSGSEAFSQLRDKLDAMHTVLFQGEEIPLSAARAKAYDPDPAVRKGAYEAELASYEKIALPMSYCLNAIKAEADTHREARHFDSILDMTLFDSNMDRATLDAMLGAIEEFLPDFRRYLRAKAKVLGHANGLPFYDLFAPMGSDQKTYTADEALDVLTDAFSRFNPKMSEFIQTAFKDRWIDMYPKKGKSGGAFCAGLHSLHQSRILMNFAGSFSDISTLAHELGHAWHNHCTDPLPLLMSDYPMPLAETASIFNETMLAHQALKTASDDMAFMLLEAELMEATQTVVDIYSRYLFESEVIQKRKDHTLSVAELKDAMLRAQDAAYGDGLDPVARHPFMWACKSHYYNKSLNFYNFPYAFGLLFGKGVFARYLEKGEAFVPEYDHLLSICGAEKVANVAASVGIDVHSIEFWRSSLAVIRDGINRFITLCANR